MSAAAPVWALLSYRAGETSQILGLAEALRDLAGLGFVEKRIKPRPHRFLVSLLRLASPAGVDRAGSSAIEPPWPRLLVSAGAKNEPLARHIRRLSGGRTKLVFLGRTWCPPERFDLVVTTPQYRLPQEPGILHNPVTITRMSPEKLAEARALWAPRFAGLPAPRIAVLIGGHSGPWHFGAAAAHRLARALAEERARTGGSLLVTTSPRTSPAAADELAALLDGPRHLHLWHRDRREDNPYFGYLACADRLVVTGDSIGMLSEAAATDRPMRIFDLGTGRMAMRRDAPPDERGNDQTVATRAYRLMTALGPARLGRDLRLAHDALLAARRADFLGHDPADESTAPLDARAATVARVLELLREENA